MDINQFIIEEQTPLAEAMKRLDQVAKKVLFVTKNNQVVAAITDGDIRRWILNRGSLDAQVREIANYQPKFVYEHEKYYAKERMKKESIDALPVLSEERALLAVITRDEEIWEQPAIDLPIVMMAGGFGTRLYPYTKILPKPLIPIGDIPIAEHIINRFNKVGSNEFHLIVNHKKNMIKAYFNEIERNYDVYYADEDIPLGTGGGLGLLKGKIDSTFILTNCDILIDENYEKMYKYHVENNHVITMVCSLKHVQVPYGVIEIEKDGIISEMKEKPEFSFFTNTGMYIVEPEVIEELEENQSIGFPDIIERYQKAGRKVGAYPISEHAWMDMGQQDEMEKMRKRLGVSDA